ncbi:hypothetical protein L211DRAFT_854422 [Terfezia boudieri ATCC MYA-4762]|uniref:Uncharacterized protein n=1 Tax=Terfezia boudieri ATCC MYA-4762 TaxID=1051890 RepID=A0A3N4L9K7_9PEZI|nr:hypothetical protein L211DRAFT_854422 [Terfezia boudieri ATCC MYA-4762]
MSEELHPFYCGGCQVHHIGPLWLQLSILRVCLFKPVPSSDSDKTKPTMEAHMDLTYFQCGVCFHNLPLEQAREHIAFHRHDRGTTLQWKQLLKAAKNSLTQEYKWRWAKSSEMPARILKWEPPQFQDTVKIVHHIPGTTWLVDASARIALCTATKTACLFCTRCRLYVQISLSFNHLEDTHQESWRNCAWSALWRAFLKTMGPEGWRWAPAEDMDVYLHDFPFDSHNKWDSTVLNRIWVTFQIRAQGCGNIMTPDWVAAAHGNILDFVDQGVAHIQLSVKPVLAIAAVLADLVEESVVSFHKDDHTAQVQTLVAYREAYNSTEHIIDTYDKHIISKWGLEWRNAFGTQAPLRAKHLFAALKQLSCTVNLKVATDIVSQVLKNRSVMGGTAVRARGLKLELKDMKEVQALAEGSATPIVLVPASVTPQGWSHKIHDISESPRVVPETQQQRPKAISKPVARFHTALFHSRFKFHNPHRFEILSRFKLACKQQAIHKKNKSLRARDTQMRDKVGLLKSGHRTVLQRTSVSVPALRTTNITNTTQVPISLEAGNSTIYTRTRAQKRNTRGPNNCAQKDKIRTRSKRQLPTEQDRQQKRERIIIVIGEDSDEDETVVTEGNIIRNLRDSRGKDLQQEELTRALYRVIAGGKRKATKVAKLKMATIALMSGLGKPFTAVPAKGAER